MKEKQITILTTRPLAQTAMLKASEAGVEIDLASFIETRSSITPAIGEKIKKYIPEDISVVFTSMNAAEAVIECLEWNDIVPDWSVYSLGGVTGIIVSNYFGGDNVIAEAFNAKQIAENIIEDNIKEVIFFCGNQRRQELPQMLQNNGVKVTEIIVYETIETPVEVNKKYNGILFFSPSAVKSFFLLNSIGADTVLFAIGTTTAEALKQFSRNKVLVSSFPNKEDLADQAIAYLTR